MAEIKISFKHGWDKDTGCGDECILCNDPIYGTMYKKYILPQWRDAKKTYCAKVCTSYKDLVD